MDSYNYIWSYSYSYIYRSQLASYMDSYNYIWSYSYSYRSQLASYGVKELNIGLQPSNTLLLPHQLLYS